MVVAVVLAMRIQNTEGAEWIEHKNLIRVRKRALEKRVEEEEEEEEEG